LRLECCGSREEVERVAAQLARERELQARLQEDNIRMQQDWQEEKLDRGRELQARMEEIRLLRVAGSRQEEEALCVEEEQVAAVRRENKRLAEQNEELQAELLGLQVREGRQLLAGQKETLPGCSLHSMSLQQLQTSLADQKEVNAQLSGYIDNVLLNIMDKYPELLEVKQSK